MSHRFRSFALIGLSVCLAAVTACTTSLSELVPDQRVDYRTSVAADALEIPPDLTASSIDDALIVPELNPVGSASLSDYQSERSARGQLAVQETILRPQDTMRIERDGDRRWINIQQSPEALWPRVTAFWTTNGFTLERSDPRIGIMETNWLENRADIPDGPIRSVLKQFLDFAYSAATRDKFRVRLEPIADGSEIYLSHYGVEETYIGRNKESTIWQQRPRDPELEAEMLNRLMVHLGASERRAQSELAKQGDDRSTATPLTRMVDTTDGYRALVVEETYDRAWRLVGLALDGSNDYAIEEQNRAQGQYVIEQRVKQEPKKGFFSRLFGGDDTPVQGERYQVRLAGRGEQTLIVVQTMQSQPATTQVAQPILESVRQVIR